LLTNLIRIVGMVGSVIVIAALLLYVTVLRSGYYHPYLQERSKIGAAWREEGIEVALVWPPITGGDGRTMAAFPEGMEIGIELLRDAAARKTPGRISPAGKIHLVRYYEERRAAGEGAESIAHKVVRNGKVVAVLGHQISVDTIPASIVYEHHGILFITPGSTDPRLTQHQFLYTFRTAPRDHDLADAMVRFAQDRKWLRVGLFFARSAAGEALGAQITEDVGSNPAMKLAFSRSYLPALGGWDELPDYRPMIARVRPEQPDAILLADSLPRSAKILSDMRTMGLAWPVVGIGKSDSAELPASIVSAATDIWLATGVNPNPFNPEFLEFRQRFSDRYGHDPGLPAIDGFEAIKLLISAIEISGSADPLVVATTMHEYPFEGLYGPFEFSDWGDIQCRSVWIKQPIFHVNPTPPPPALVQWQNTWEHQIPNAQLPCSCRRPKEVCK
jgi:branched-chain amino acid transport system substrate-binding protein